MKIAPGLGLAVALLTITTSSIGGEWRGGAGVTPGLIFTDNVCLSSDNKQSELIATAAPDIYLNTEGRRFNLGLAAAVEINSLSDERLVELNCQGGAFGGRSQFNPRGNLNLQTTLVDQWLYLDASASAQQSSVSPFFATGDDTLNRTGNANTVYSYGIAPRIQRRFKDFAELLLSYSLNEQSNSSDLVNDTRSQTAVVDLNSQGEGGAFFWRIRGDYNLLEYSQSVALQERDNELSSVRATTGYQVSTAWQFNATAGQEFNDFVSISDDIDGEFWDLGVVWQPNARTSIDAGYGDRFFGAAPRFSARYRHKRSVVQISYARDLTYDRNLRTLQDPLPSENAFGQQIDPSSGQPLALGDTPTTVSNSPILDERFTLSYAFQGRRSGLQISASHSDQTRTEDGRDSTFSNVSISGDRALAQNLNVFTSVSYGEQVGDVLGGQQIADSQTYRFSFGFNRSFNQNINAILRYDWTDRQSEILGDAYRENRLTLNFRFAI